MRLYHYCCEHTRNAVGRRGLLIPQPQPVLNGLRLLWLTNQEEPDREGLGLTSQILACDRLQYRYIVETEKAKHYADIVADAPFVGRMMLEAAKGARPELWWVVRSAVTGELDRNYVFAGGNQSSMEPAKATSAKRNDPHSPSTTMAGAEEGVMTKDQKDGAGLIHQAIPDVVETEPRLSRKDREAAIEAAFAAGNRTSHNRALALQYVDDARRLLKLPLMKEK